MNIVPSLGITSFRENNNDVNNDNIDNTIRKFEGHPNIVTIKEQIKNQIQLSLSRMLEQTKFALIIKKLNTKKASKSDDMPTKVIKEFGTFFADFP